ncbi:hypothetical protein DFP72DRAFT_988151 [Ephemerocybe angulata]|uniref:Uncharacterized protein n=1 Tax=Ephemerocybe angulata TaxID=980116 RepID=A0A8H6MAE4_9AGAR|nr:hypothetical protein DFP72DRAFT_988151 [Tulosesus angulatus]
MAKAKMDIWQQQLRDQKALIKLGELYRDQKAAQGSSVITQSRSFMSSTAKAKTTNLKVHLLESRVYPGIGNFPKAKAALTSIRMHAEEEDYTAASLICGRRGMRGLGALKYMLLCKVMLNLPEDVNALLTVKFATKYAQLRDVESMRALARAHQDRNLAGFEKALREYKDELSSDPTIRSHLASLLSQMTLDKVFHGVLDQGRGCLLSGRVGSLIWLYWKSYGAAIETLEEVGKAVQSLYAKTVQIA